MATIRWCPIFQIIPTIGEKNIMFQVLRFSMDWFVRENLHRWNPWVSFYHQIYIGLSGVNFPIIQFYEILKVKIENFSGLMGQFLGQFVKGSWRVDSPSWLWQSENCPSKYTKVDSHYYVVIARLISGKSTVETIVFTITAMIVVWKQGTPNPVVNHHFPYLRIMISGGILSIFRHGHGNMVVFQICSPHQISPRPGSVCSIQSLGEWVQWGNLRTRVGHIPGGTPCMNHKSTVGSIVKRWRIVDHWGLPSGLPHVGGNKHEVNINRMLNPVWPFSQHTNLSSSAQKVCQNSLEVKWIHGNKRGNATENTDLQTINE